MFLAFLAVVFLAYGIVPRKYRCLFLVLCSYYFYDRVSDQLALTLFGLTTSTYFLAQAIERSNGSKRTYWLMCALGGVFGILFYFKYLDVFLRGLSELVNWRNLGPGTFGAIGLSFISFQITAYLFDVYYTTQKASRSYLSYSLFIVFFPKLLQGPIERASSLLPQLERLAPLGFDNLRKGFFVAAWGLFLKMVIADRIGSIYVDPVYGNLDSALPSESFLAMFLYPLQIYFDFLGYTRVAQGVARVFGITLTDNFNRPLSATSSADYWRRWHISLSTWLRDYLYLPLQMLFRRFGVYGSMLAIFLTFSISGVWHGASVGFIAWGVFHGVWLAVELYVNHRIKSYKGLRSILDGASLRHLKIIYTFVLVSISLVLFRSTDLGTSTQIIKKSGEFCLGLGSFDFAAMSNLASASLHSRFLPYPQVGEFHFIVLGVALLIFYAVQKYEGRWAIEQFSALRQWILAELLIISTAILGVLWGSNFAYFKF